VDPLPEDAVGVGGQGLLESQEIEKRVYRLANWVVQKSGEALHTVIRRAQAEAAEEKECRLDRKRRHTAMRCAFVYRIGLHLVSHLRFVHSSAVAKSPDTALLRSLSVDPCSVLFAVHARTGVKSGRLFLTPFAIVFHASIIGFKTLVTIPYAIIQSITVDAGMIGSSLTVKYHDTSTHPVPDVDSLLGAPLPTHGSVVPTALAEFSFSVTGMDLDNVLALIQLLRQIVLDGEAVSFDSHHFGCFRGLDDGSEASHLAQLPELDATLQAMIPHLDPPVSHHTGPDPFAHVTASAGMSVHAPTPAVPAVPDDPFSLLMAEP
jgi:hypothetical protein